MLTKRERQEGYKMIERVRKCRRDNLRAIAATYPSWRAFADACAIAPSMASQIAGANPTRAIGEALARTLEQRLKLPHGFLDIVHR